MKKIIRMFIYFTSLLVFISCSSIDDNPTEYYTVTYYANGASGGSTPVDEKEYSNGDSVNISGVGDLYKDNCVFFNWNTQADGSGEYYYPGYINIGSENLTLYAQWMPVQEYGDYIVSDTSDEIIIIEYIGPDNGMVVIPFTINDVPVTSIGDFAFYGLSNIEEIHFPQNITSIGRYAFLGCSSLIYVTIPDNVISVGEAAFASCDNLTHVILPEGLIDLGDTVFAHCYNLENVNIPDGVTSLGRDLFNDCHSLQSIIIPNNVTSIGDHAFWGCTSLTSIEIPDSVTTIGDNAFASCTTLKSITIPSSVTEIGYGLFQNCFELENVTLPDGIPTIGNYTFNSCNSMTDITIPYGVINIEDSVITDCTNLQRVSFPETLTSLGSAVINRCENLTDLYIYSLVAPTTTLVHSYRNDEEIIYNGTFFMEDITLHIKNDATGYDVDPWNDTSIFSSIVRDL